MTRQRFAAFIVGLSVVGASTQALAHHGNAAYADTITEFKNATVTKLAWANPHALIDFDATDASGKPVHMVCETAAPAGAAPDRLGEDVSVPRRRRDRADVRRQERQPRRPAEQDHPRRRLRVARHGSLVETPAGRPASALASRTQRTGT